MCKYSVLTQSKEGLIRYCHDCQTYNLVFKNLMMNFAPSGLSGFKNSLSDCYDHHIENRFPDHRDVKDITFNTRLDGMQLLFSTNEIATILAMIQDAELAFMAIGDWGQEHHF